MSKDVASYLNERCFVQLPMSPDRVQSVFSKYNHADRELYDLCMSHERLRNELAVARDEIQDLRRELFELKVKE